MNLAALGLLVMFFRLLLRLNWIICIVLFLLLLAMFPFHRKKNNEKKRQEQRFADVCLYIDTLLYAFEKNGKIDGAIEETAEALPEGKLKETVIKALDHMRLTFDDSDILADGLAVIEQEYPCRRIKNIHRFMEHVEYYGGNIRHSVQLFLKDKARWEKRIRDTMQDRRKMWTEILFSVIVSLIICGMIMHFPVMELDISTQPVTQILAVVVIFLDDLIIQKSQKLLAPDWLELEEEKEDEFYEKKMDSFRHYDEKKDKRLSLILGIAGCAGTFGLYFFGGQWAGLAGLGITIAFFNQHRIGRYMAKKTLEKGIICSFPVWLMDLVLLLQSENVQVALEKSMIGVPGVLKEELAMLTSRLQVSPESGEPYHLFLKDFHLPQVSSAMSMLYGFSVGNGGSDQGQVEELVGRNLDMMDRAQEIRLKNKSGAMFGLFLAPVMTASLKLFVDMGLIMMSFLSSAVI